MTPEEARDLINTEGRQHTMLAYFSKRDGTLRRMLFLFEGKGSSRPQYMTVHDLEKGEDRTLNLETLASLRVLKSRVKREDREPKPRTFEEVRGELHQLFY